MFLWYVFDEKIYLPTLRPIIADSYWAINSLFFKSFAIITDETQIFHPPCNFPPKLFSAPGFHIGDILSNEKLSGKKTLEPIAAIFLAWKKSIMKTSPNFNYLPCRYFWRGGKQIWHTSHGRYFEERPTFQFHHRHFIHYGILNCKVC